MWYSNQQCCYCQSLIFLFLYSSNSYFFKLIYKIDNLAFVSCQPVLPPSCSSAWRSRLGGSCKRRLQHYIYEKERKLIGISFEIQNYSFDNMFPVLKWNMWWNLCYWVWETSTYLNDMDTLCIQKYQSVPYLNLQLRALSSKTHLLISIFKKSQLFNFFLWVLFYVSLHSKHCLFFLLFTPMITDKSNGYLPVSCSLITSFGQLSFECLCMNINNIVPLTKNLWPAAQPVQN